MTLDEITKARILGWLTGPQADQARAVAKQLPHRLDVACAVCENPDCTRRYAADIGGCVVVGVLDESDGKYASPHDLTVVFVDGATETFPAIQGSWIDNGVLRLRCRDDGKSHLYALPLTGIRMWHRELS